MPVYLLIRVSHLIGLVAICCHTLTAQSTSGTVDAPLQVAPLRISTASQNNEIQYITRDHLNRLWFLSKHADAPFTTPDYLQLTCYDGVQAVNYPLESLPGLDIHTNFQKIIFRPPHDIYIIPLFHEDPPAVTRALYRFDIDSRSLREVTYEGRSLHFLNKYMSNATGIWINTKMDGEPWLASIRDTSIVPLFKLAFPDQWLVHISSDAVWTATQHELICYNAQGLILHRHPLPGRLAPFFGAMAWTTDQIEFLTDAGAYEVFDPATYIFHQVSASVLSKPGCSKIETDASGNRLYLYSHPRSFKHAFLVSADATVYDLGEATKTISSVADVWSGDLMDAMLVSHAREVFEIRLQNLSVHKHLGNYSIRKISLQDDGLLYVATESDGIFRSAYQSSLHFDKYADYAFNRYFLKTGNGEVYNSSRFLGRRRGTVVDAMGLGVNPHDIISNGPGHLLVADHGNGLREVDLSSWTMQTLIPFTARVVHQFAMTHPDTAIIATDQGLMIGTPERGIVSTLFASDPPICLSHEQGNQWLLGTRAGYVIRTALPNPGRIDTLAITGSSIVTITPDDRENLWIGTFAGIYVYSGPSTPLQKLQYPDLDQIECNRFSAFYDSGHHRLLIGTLAGLYEVNVRTARLTDAVPSIFLSSVCAYGLTGPGEDTVYFDGDEKYNLHLKANHRTFTVTFSPGLLADHTTIRYYYVLLREQDQPDDQTAWTNHGNTPSITLSNLESGYYTLWIKAQQPGSHVESNHLQLTIRANPYFYNSWWFYVLVFSLVGLAVYYRNQYLKRENVRLEHEVDKRTRQIRKDKETIQQQAEALTELDQMKNRFFTHISHELKTPLTLIKGPIERLLKQHHPDAEREMLELVRRNTGLLTDRVNELLELSRLERSMVQLDLRPQDMQAFMSQYVDLFSLQTASMGIALSIHTAFEEPVYVIDAPKTGKIIQNLTSNALKYCPPGSTVHIHIEMRDDQCTIRVEDDGPGIDAVHHERIFEKFYQVPDHRNHHDPGSGIGLSMVREYVELMQGTIELHSAQGQGTAFLISFPVTGLSEHTRAAAGNAADVEMESGIPFFPVPEGASVLVVEDHPELRQYLQHILQESFHISAVANGREAVEWLMAGHTADLVLSDIMMPEMDGLQLLEWIRQQEQYAMMPCIFLTAKTQDYTRLRALRLGVDDYINKPFSEQELILRISRLLHHARIRQVEHSEAMTDDAASGQIQHENATILQIQEFIRDHIADPTFSAAAVAEHVGVSERTLRRFIRRETGMSPKELITEVQMDQLRRLRAEYPDDSIISLSARVGYTDPKYMARIFYERWGYRL